MSQQVNLKDVGRSPDDVLRTSGIEGLATIVGFWMFTHNDDHRQFWGSVNTALRQLYGDGVRELTKTERRQIQKRLNREGFLFIRTENGPRWQTPTTWSWEHRDEERDAAPIPQPPPGPVTLSFRCQECGQKFETQVRLMQHVNLQHKRSNRNPYSVQKVVLEAAKKHPGMTAVELTEVIEGDYSYPAVVRAARKLVDRRKLRQERVGGSKRGKKQGYDIELYPARWKRSTPAEVPEPAPAPKVREEPPQDPESTPEEPGDRIIMRPDGRMYRVVRTLPDGSVELEVLS